MDNLAIDGFYLYEDEELPFKEEAIEEKLEALRKEALIREKESKFLTGLSYYLTNLIKLKKAKGTRILNNIYSKRFKPCPVAAPADMLQSILLTHTDENKYIVFFISEAINNKNTEQISVKLSDLTPYFLNCMKILSIKGYNVYCSQNMFFDRSSREEANSWSSEQIKVDIDYYKVPELQKKKPEEIYQLILDSGVLKGIEPSQAEYSGNGIYLIWNIRKLALYKMSSNKSLWKHVINTLIKRLKPFGADDAACDISRVNRLMNTKNSKTGNYSSILDRKALSNLKVYEISELASVLLPYTPEQVKTYKEQQQLAKEERRRKAEERAAEVIYIDLDKKRNTIRSLQYGVMQDIRSLLKIRGYDASHKRDLLIHIYTQYSKWYHKDDSKFKSDMYNLNGLFTHPLSMNELENIITYEKPYKYSFEKIIERLEITDDELKYLKSISTAEERANKLNEKRRQSRKNENNNNSRQQAKADNLKKIAELVEKGMKQIEIANVIGLNKSVISRYIKQLKNG